MLTLWKSLPPTVRRWFTLVLKATLTVGAFYLLLNHQVDDGEGGKVSILNAILDHISELEMEVFIPFVLAATVIKGIGILCSMFRWHLLLIGQGIRFNFWHVIGSFLIGRFLGTFLPSTVGLDSYKLYDAARFSKKVVEPAAATAVEKVMGLSGVFLTFLVTLPFGYHILYDVLGDAATATLAVTVVISLGVVVGMFTVLFRPGIVEKMLGLLPALGRRKVEGFLTKVSHAATATGARGACWRL